jgi:hypothetical protein
MIDCVVTVKTGNDFVRIALFDLFQKLQGIDPSNSFRLENDGSKVFILTDPSAFNQLEFGMSKSAGCHSIFTQLNADLDRYYVFTALIN